MAVSTIQVTPQRRMQKTGPQTAAQCSARGVCSAAQLMLMLMLSVGPGCGSPTSPTTASPPSTSQTSSLAPVAEPRAVDPSDNQSPVDTAATSPPADMDGSNSLSEQVEFRPLPPRAVSPSNATVRPSNSPTTTDAASTPSAGVKPIDRLRLPDDRPELNERRLQASGIRIHRGRRLILLTDVHQDSLAALPALADRLFDALEAHFGTLAPASDGSSFQVTGCLIQEKARFRSAGLLPTTDFSFQHGRHLNYQFWMFDQQDEYYRRHLMLHEFTHCFMTCESGMQDIPPLWFIEGMAEYFATHRLSPHDSASDTVAAFGILPAGYSDFEGWGRISELRRLAATNPDSPTLGIRPLPEVMPSTVVTFNTDAQYAQSWGLCWLLQTHPTYRSAFAPLAQTRTRAAFLHAIAQVPDHVMQRLKLDWLLVRESLREGFDISHSFPTHCETPLKRLGKSPVTLKLQAAADWQQAPIQARQDERLKLTCSGRFQINDDAQPWISEPQGVSVDYVRHIPLGCTIGVFVSQDGEQISQPMPIGTGTVLTAPFDGTLWLQANDASSSRHDNAGTIHVKITSGP